MNNGSHYYIEALHKEQYGNDSLAVAVKTPDNKFHAPIPSQFLWTLPPPKPQGIPNYIKHKFKIHTDEHTGKQTDKCRPIQKDRRTDNRNSTTGKVVHAVRPSQGLMRRIHMYIIVDRPRQTDRQLVKNEHQTSGVVCERRTPYQEG